MFFDGDELLTTLNFESLIPKWRLPPLAQSLNTNTNTTWSDVHERLLEISSHVPSPRPLYRNSSKDLLGANVSLKGVAVKTGMILPKLACLDQSRGQPLEVIGVKREGKFKTALSLRKTIERPVKENKEQFRLWIKEYKAQHMIAWQTFIIFWKRANRQFKCILVQMYF